MMAIFCPSDERWRDYRPPGASYSFQPLGRNVCFSELHEKGQMNVGGVDDTAEAALGKRWGGSMASDNGLQSSDRWRWTRGAGLWSVTGRTEQKLQTPDQFNHK